MSRSFLSVIILALFAAVFVMLIAQMLPFTSTMRGAVCDEPSCMNSPPTFIEAPSSDAATSPPPSDTSEQVPPEQTGCIGVELQAFDTQDPPASLPPPTAAFHLSSDGTELATIQSDAAGNATFNDLPFGTYQIEPDPVDGWTDPLPRSAEVTVEEASCTQVSFTTTLRPDTATFAVWISNERTEAAPGDTLTYTIIVQNTSAVAGTTI